MVEFEKLKAPAQTEMDRAMELAKVEAFDYWIDGKPKQKSKITAKTMLYFQKFPKESQQSLVTLSKITKQNFIGLYLKEMNCKVEWNNKKRTNSTFANGKYFRL